MFAVSHKQDIIKIAQRVLKAEMQGLEKISSTLDDNLVQAIELILASSGKIIVSGVGKSGHVAKKFTATLASTGSTAVFLHPTEAVHGDLGVVADNDVVILLSNSGETSELNPIISYCKRYGVKIISITRNANSTLSTASNISLVLENVPEASHIGAPTTSTTQMMAFCDIIAVVLQEHRQFSKHDFQAIHPAGAIGAKLSVISELMHKDSEIPLINIDATLADAIFEISQKRFGCVGVVNSQNQIIGMITDGDIRRHIDSDIRNTLAKDIMTQNPLTVSSTIFASEVLKILNDNKRTNIFVVSENDEVLGVVHIHDLLKARVS